MPRKTWAQVRAELVEAWNRARHGPSPSMNSIEARLKKLHQLYEEGQIDHDDFETKKAQILQEI